MKIFIKSINDDIWDTIMNGPDALKHTVNGESIENHGLNGLM